MNWGSGLTMSMVLNNRNIEQMKVNVQNKIEAKSIYFDYDGLEILQDINLTIKEGEFVVFMGPSGSGKSTLLRLLIGLAQPKQGKIRVNNQSIADSLPNSSVVF